MDGSRNLKKGSPFIASKLRAKRHRPMMELLPHTDTDEIQGFIKEEEFLPNQVFNADETGIF